MNTLNNVSSVSSLLHQSFGGASGSGSFQQGLVDGGVVPNPLSSIGTGMDFNHPSSSFTTNPSGQVQGQQQFSSTSGSHMTQQQQALQLDPQNFERKQRQLQQFSIPSNPQQQPQSQQQQFQAVQNGLGGVAPVKLESQVTDEQALQQLQALQNLGSVKLEPQGLQSMRNLGPVKMEPQNPDLSLLSLHQQQQQQQQQLLLSRQSSHPSAVAQKLLKSMPPQRSPVQLQFQPQNLSLRSPLKPVYEPGTCARRLMHYMYQQQHRPEDNNIEFWGKFVAEYFAPNAKKIWCVSMYGSGRQATGVLPQDVWHCNICNCKPGHGFEATVEVLPRLFKIKYESGTFEEQLYVDMPQEYQNSCGQIVLDYAKATQESVFERLRVVRDGQLRIVFSPDLKICSWEFCARRHEELIPRRLLIPQVSQLGAAADKWQATTPSNISVSEQQNNCNVLAASARQLTKVLEVPLVNDLGYTKRYVRCLQISEVVNSMKDLIDYSRETGTGPMESLTKFSQRTAPAPVSQGQPQQPEEQQQHLTGQNSNNDCPVQSGTIQLASSNGMPSVENTAKSVPATSSTSTTVGLLHKNSNDSRQQNPTTANSVYGVYNVQMPSPGSSTMLKTHLPASPFQSPMPSSSNNLQPTSHGRLSGTHMTSVTSPSISRQQPSLSGDADANDSQSSVQKIIHDMMVPSQLGGSMIGTGTMGCNVTNVNGMLSASNTDCMSGSNILVGNGVAGSIAQGLGHSAMIKGIPTAHGDNSSMNGRAGTIMYKEQSINQQQQDSGNQPLSGIGGSQWFQ